MYNKSRVPSINSAASSLQWRERVKFLVQLHTLWMFAIICARALFDSGLCLAQALRSRCFALRVLFVLFWDEPSATMSSLWIFTGLSTADK